MKRRGVRIINRADLHSVTSDAKAKDHFAILDCMAVCEPDMKWVRDDMAFPSSSLRTMPVAALHSPPAPMRLAA
jgi:hypothetical protein